jgi:uncharacterized membrane protein
LNFELEKRTQTADLLKGIAALLMIQVHLIELFATPAIYNSNLGKTLLFLGGPPVAPVFLILFGYFIAASKKTILELIIRAIKIIFLGLLLNIALNFNLILSVYKGLLNIDVWPYIFGVDILPLAGLSLFVIALLSPVWRSNSAAALFIIIGLIFSSAFLGTFLLPYTVETPFLKFIFSSFYGASWWSYFPLFPWLSYSLAGIVFYKISKLGTRSSKLEAKKFALINFINSPNLAIRGVVAILFSLFVIATIGYAIGISSDLQLYYHHGVLFFLWVILFLSFYSFFINEIEKALGASIVFKYIKWLGKNITVIYVIQWIIIGNIATEIYKTVSNPSYLFFSFMAILAVSSGICYVWIISKKRFTKNNLTIKQ